MRENREYLEREEIETLPWPAFSPDQSPIEHLWDEVGRRVHNREHQPENLAELTQAVLEEWDNVPRETIRKLMRSTRKRILACIEADGGTCMVTQGTKLS